MQFDSKRFQKNITLQARYLPGVVNTTADYLSRLPNKYEWKMTQICSSILTSYGLTHNRQIRDINEYSTSSFQQEICRASYHRNRRSGTHRLARSQQLLQPTIQDDTSVLASNRKQKCMGNNNSTILESTTLVSKTSGNGGLSPLKLPKWKAFNTRRSATRTIDKPTVGHLCLESLWSHDSMLKGWSKRASFQLPLRLGPSTLDSYNRVIEKFQKFCGEQCSPCPQNEPAIVAEFLCAITDASESSKSTLKITQAALGHLYRVSNQQNPMESPYIHMLISALVKSATYKPLNKSCVMPIKPFAELFSQWPDNEKLCIKRLRLKTITLMALTLMLRPSDFGPKSVHFNSETFEQPKWLFSTNNVVFLNSGCAKIVFHGIKNDVSFIASTLWTYFSLHCGRYFE